MGGKSRARVAVEAERALPIVQRAGLDPAKYHKGFDRKCEELAWLGHTNAEIAETIGVAPSNFDKWAVEKTSLRNALARAREKADGKVVRGLHRSAVGATVKERKVVMDGAGNVTQVIELTKELPPSTPAGTLWLTNRQRSKWRDAKQVEHSGSVDLMAAIKAATSGDQAKVIEGEATTSGSDEAEEA